MSTVDMSIRTEVTEDKQDPCTGKAILFALVFILFMFISGLKRVTTPCSFLYAFMPSKRVWA
jgi:hypothetical protein